MKLSRRPAVSYLTKGVHSSRATIVKGSSFNTKTRELSAMTGGISWSLLAILVTQCTAGCPKECECNPKTKVVDCRGRGLYDVPRKLQLDTQELYLQNNRIRSLGSMAFRETPLLRVLNLANNSITSVSAKSFQGLRGLLVLNLANNRLQRLDRALLESLTNLQALFFHSNPWNCDCQLIGLKLWLETFLFKGGKIDEVKCAKPEDLKERDLRRIPYELFHSCLTANYNYLFAKLHHLDGEHRPLRSHAHGERPGEGLPECNPKQRPRPVNLRHAMATVVITGVVCGIVCLMMLTAAIYGCAYAAIMARYQRALKRVEQVAPSEEHGSTEEKEPLDSSVP